MKGLYQKLSKFYPHLKMKNLFAFVLFFGLGALSTLLITYTFAHGGDTNLIHACVKTSNGSITIVGANDTCGSNETALDWNIQGIQGPPGQGGSSGLVCIACLTVDILHRINEADLTGVNFNDANLAHSILSNNDISGSSFVYAVLSGVDLTGVNATGVDFSHVNLYGATLSNADLSNTIFIAATLNSSIHNAEADNANFSNSNMRGVDLRNSNLSGSIMTNVNLLQSYLVEANFLNVDLTNANLTEANFTGAINVDTTIRTGVIWSNTTCPDGTNSDDNGGTCEGHLTP